MATLVLTTVGTALGGPIGGAIGSVIGGFADRTLLFPSRGRQGARLGELSVQTSTYGAAIPRLFGTLRVAGTVIWATDLREERHRSGGGKSGPRTTTYSYSASFAVAISGRPIRAVHRIWAEGKLLRGATGDWKSETGFRLYLGGEDQPVDPLIASAEGIGNSPAYRGVAYALFEHMQLADFGNRIPSLTFEVEADDGPVPVAAIAAELCESVVAGGGGPALRGYAASGDSARGAIEALAAALPIAMRDDGERLVLGGPAGDPVMLAEAELGATGEERRAARREIERRAAGTLPDEIGVAYYEPQRDYQAGLQRARRGGAGRRGERIELPAALSAEEAKGVAEARLARAWRERARMTLRLPWRRMDLRPGMLVRLPGDDALWRIAGWTLDRMAIELSLLREGQALAAPSGAAPGRATQGPDAPMGATVLRLLDLPPLEDGLAASPRLWIAAAGTGAGWRRAEISTSLDGGASWTAIGQSAAPAIIGAAVDALGTGEAALFDRAGAVTIELLHAGMTLSGADDDALIGGANIAMLGDELIQFGSAEQVGPRRFRLSRLLRGRRGSEWAMAGHVAGEPFVLIEAAALLPVDLPVAALGTTLSVMGVGPGDDGVPAMAERAILGRAVRPPAPVRLGATRLGDGTIRFAWTRRSRIGWAWIDGSDAPLGEEQERYRLTITPETGAIRIIETPLPSHDYGPDAQAADGATLAMRFTIMVEQMGALAPSLPGAIVTFAIQEDQ